ncbi:MAG: ATP-binding protein, partial [Pseudomonadota bacterium]
DDEQMPPAWEKPITQMRGQAQRMSQILKELLELSRLESSGAASSEESINVAGLLDTVRRDFERPSGAARIIINAESSAELLGVRSEIESVVVNLLSNALRYTPDEGEITIIWRSNPEGAQLIVSDTGIGIDPADISRLTERFFRVDRGRSRGEGGVGLGLAIVKHVLVRHDADLEISSVPDEGSVFTCHFPPERVVVAPPVSTSTS